MKKVELLPAYCWHCENCGRENFERGIVAEMSDEDEVGMKEEFGIEPWEDGNFMMMPEKVTCPHCNEDFETTHYCEE